MSTTTVKLRLNVRKTRAKALTDFLKTVPYVEVEESADAEIPGERLQPGTRRPGEKLTEFAGLWKNHPHLSAEEIREQAWQRKPRK
jgi:hypothetical protein